MELNLPKYKFSIKQDPNGKHKIYDESRNKYIQLTPEEWVRQNFVKYLKEAKNYPASLIAIEKGIVVNTMQKRFDAVVYNNIGKPRVLIEFKSPGVKINQEVMDQVSRYNIALNVEYLIVSNGLVHYCCRLNTITNEVMFLSDIPKFSDL